MRDAAARPAAGPPVKPILKWAGGKRQLLPALRRFYPPSFDRYIEPFLGSGAVFLDLHNRGLLDGRHVRLSDINADVIGCYLMVRDRVDEVIDVLRGYEEGHRAEARKHFYEIRDNRFNPRRLAIHEAANPAAAYTPDVAAMLIYLNRTGYNGLFRLNSRGVFNVPVGRHGKIRICDADNLRRLAGALARPDVSLGVRRFGDALSDATAGDFVYLDPPYSPVSGTSYFTSYTSERFGPEQQAALQRAVIALTQVGARVLLSNSVAPDIRALYDESPEARGAGLRASMVPARRAINSRAAGRGAVMEYLISNVQPRES